MRVPMIVRWPASKQAGRTYGELVSSIDFVPTMLDLAGITPPAGADIDGRSYRAVLEGSEAPIQDAIFSELGSARSVKTKKWKYITVRYTEKVAPANDSDHVLFEMYAALLPRCLDSLATFAFGRIAVLDESKWLR